MIVDGHGFHKILNFGVQAKENQDKITTFYWLPKHHKNPIKQDLLLKVSKGAKIRNRNNQVPHLTQDTNEKVPNSQ